MKSNAGMVIEAFGKNEQVKKVFRTLFVVMAGLMMARVFLLLGIVIGYLYNEPAYFLFKGDQK